MAGVSTASIVSEFIGTFLLVLAVGCNVLSNNVVWGGVAIGTMLMVSVYALGSASGGNFNPAVSVALGLANKMDDGWNQVGIYCAVQVVAGLIGAQCAKLVFDGSELAVQPAPLFHLWEAATVEIFYTFMLCFVVLNVAASKNIGGKNQFFGLAIGFVVIAGAYGAGAISGGCFNPAVAIGLGMSSLTLHGGFYCLAYACFELAAAALAVCVFQLIRPEEKDDSVPPQKYGLQSRLLAEFLGTFTLVLTVGLNVLADSKAAAFSIAASLTCMIYALGDVSGGHFNPAVTTAIWCSGRGKISSRDADYYVLSQLAGGALAAAAYSIVHHGFTFPLGPKAPHGWFGAGFAEVTFTFVLCFVVLCVATRRKAPAVELIAFVIGSCVTVGGFAVGGISGGSLNPAVSFGIALAHVFGGGLFYEAVVYALLELGGGLLAAVLFRVVYPGEYTKAEDEEDGAAAAKPRSNSQ